MASDVQQLSIAGSIGGVDFKDPYSGWKLKNENIYTKVSDNITKPKEVSDPGCLDNSLENSLKVEKVDGWYADTKDENNVVYIEYGLFTSIPIEASQFIIEFCGKFTTWDAFRNSKGKLTRQNFRGLIFPEKGLCIDSIKQGNISRYLRRSCKPNSKIIEKWIDGRMRLGVFCESEKIEAGSEITIPFDFSWQSLRNGLECACSKKEECPVFNWYQERKKMSDQFLMDNKIELIQESKIDDKKESRKEIDTPKTYQAKSNPNNRREKNPLSREEKKLQKILQTFDKMEKEEKKATAKQSPKSNLSQNRNLPKNNYLNNKKKILASSMGSSRAPPNKRPLNLNNERSRNSIDPKSKLVGKKAWMNKYLKEENESRSEENQTPSPNNEENDSPTLILPLDHDTNIDNQQKIENNNNISSNNNNVNISPTNSVEVKKESSPLNNSNTVNNNPSIHPNSSLLSSNSNLVNTSPLNTHSSIPINIKTPNLNHSPTINVNSVPPKNSISNANTLDPTTLNNNIQNPEKEFNKQIIQTAPQKQAENTNPFEIPNQPLSNQNTPNNQLPQDNQTQNQSSTITSQLPNQALTSQPPNLSDVMLISSEGTRDHLKRKLEESHHTTPPQQEIIDNTNSINNNLPSPSKQNPQPPNSPPASPPDIGPELPPSDQKKRKIALTGDLNSFQDEITSNLDHPPNFQNNSKDFTSIENNSPIVSPTPPNNHINNTDFGKNNNLSSKINYFEPKNQNGFNNLDFSNQQNGIHSNNNNLPIDSSHN